MKKGILLLSICCCLVVKSYAQDSLRDSIKLTLKHSPKTFVGFHNRNTFIRSNQTKLYGIIAGLDYNKKIKLFVGLYGFGQENKTELINNSDFVEDTVTRYLSTNNLSIGIDYTYFTKGKFRLSVPLQIGFGGLYQEYFSRGDIIKSDQSALFPIETGTNAYLELLPWTGIKAGVGYRLSLGNKNVLKLTSPYYNLGLAVLLGELYKSIKN
ncbi:MAG: hypothetical protein KJP21_06400 [Bacteroidia bacterium]|nr:hypothetical protein [Bacteroidia bacterium]NNJ55607.1 hypothetical protein [Bacteroidia bacterium]